MSKQEQTMILLLENMQKSLDEKDEIIDKLNTQNKIQEEQNKIQASTIKILEQKVDYLTRQLFSQKSEKSEKLPDGQLSLFDDLENKEVEEIEEEEIEVTYTRAKGGKKRPPAHLPRVRVEHDISDEEKICSCGCMKKVIEEVTTEQYDVIPATFQVIQKRH